MSSANAGRAVSLPTACVHSRCRFIGIDQAGESGAPTPVGGRHGPGGGTFFTTVLVMDYNAGNNLAVTIEIEEREPRPGSPGDVPVNMLD